MSKEEFVNALVQRGYNAVLNGSLPTVYTDGPYEDVRDFARANDYNYSFAVKKPQITKEII